MENFLDSLAEHLQPSAELSVDVSNFLTMMGLALVMGIMLKLLYQIYFKENEPQDASLARALIIVTPTLAAIFWMIQTNLVLSLGMLGSLSFVRFRTPIKRAEDIAFLLVALASAIACSISQYLISVGLIGLLYAFTFARNIYLDRLGGRNNFAIVTFNSKKVGGFEEINTLLEEQQIRADFISSRTYDGITSFVFNIPKLSQEQHQLVVTQLTDLDSESHVNIFYPNERLGA